jgi:hypothetical protein
LAALLLFPLDVAVRRLVIDMSPLYRRLRAMAAALASPFRRRREAAGAESGAMARLRDRKAKTVATRPAADVEIPQSEVEMPEEETVSEESEAVPETRPESEVEPPESEDGYASRLLKAKRRALRGRDWNRDKES